MVGTICELLEIGRIGAIISENFQGNFRMALTADECVAQLKSDDVDACCQAAEESKRQESQAQATAIPLLETCVQCSDKMRDRDAGSDQTADCSGRRPVERVGEKRARGCQLLSGYPPGAVGRSLRRGGHLSGQLVAQRVGAGDRKAYRLGGR